MSALQPNKNILDLIEDCQRPSLFIYQYVKWQDMCMSINADMEQEIVRCHEAIRRNADDTMAQNRLGYLERTFKSLHDEVVWCEDLFTSQIVAEDLSNFYMLSNAVMGRISRSYSPKRLVEETAPDEPIDWNAFLTANTISDDPSDAQWLSLGWGMLCKLVDDVKLASVRLDRFCKNVVLIDEFMSRNKDNSIKNGHRFLELIETLADAQPHDVETSGRTEDLVNQLSTALTAGQRRCAESPDAHLANFQLSGGDFNNSTSGQKQTVRKITNRFDRDKTLEAKQEIDVLTKKTLNEYELMKKRMPNLSELEQDLEKRLRNVKLARRTDFSQFAEQRVDTVELLQNVRNFMSRE